MTGKTGKEVFPSAFLGGLSVARPAGGYLASEQRFYLDVLSVPSPRVVYDGSYNGVAAGAEEASRRRLTYSLPRRPVKITRD